MALNKTQTSNDEVVMNGVLAMASRGSAAPWIGTMTQLNEVLAKMLGKRDRKLLPKSSSALRVALNRVVNRLRNRKISVKFGRTTDHTRTRFVKFTF